MFLLARRLAASYLTHLHSWHIRMELVEAHFRDNNGLDHEFEAEGFLLISSSCSEQEQPELLGDKSSIIPPNLFIFCSKPVRLV